MNNYLFTKWKKKFISEAILDLLYSEIISSMFFAEDQRCRYMVKLASSYGVEKELLVKLEEHWDNIGIPIDEYMTTMYKYNIIREALGGKRKSLKEKKVVKSGSKR